YLIAVEKNVHFDQVRGAVIQRRVIERSIPPGNRFQPVVKIKNDFCERYLKGELDSLRSKIYLMRHRTPLFHTQGHDASDVVGFGDNLSLNIGLVHPIE